ncbi:transposase [Yimella sp. cx-51]|uniref:IS701 family transposase n=1 Tax=Yimella sp. cx-51 TaxID=2770551 RepID=UPI00165D9C20|nr:transposase [Yimella sp. cx-51]MBC9957966.1 transposase [Yimella sp. cx-51]QTH38094.1 transposase [Yimella sp. cx-51]
MATLGRSEPRWSNRSQPVDAALLDRLCGEVFADVRRNDQRRRATQYVRGLVRTEGRCSIQAIASHSEVDSQSLHHFVNYSPWCWRQARSKLASFVDGEYGIDAIVIRPAEVRRAGENSVGSARAYSHQHGRVVNRQVLLGVWAVSGQRATPIDWSLVLPPAWLEDHERCGKAGVPDDQRQPGISAAFDAAMQTFDELGLGSVPLVTDLTNELMEPEVQDLVQLLDDAAMPYFARVPRTLPLVRIGNRHATVGHIVKKYQQRMIPMNWPHWCGHRHPAAAAAEAVVGESAKQRRLFFSRDERSGVRSWLTNVADADLSRCLEVSQAAALVRQREAWAFDQCGITDYSGRFFSGLHRHLTLASVACTGLQHVVPRVEPFTCGRHPSP